MFEKSVLVVAHPDDEILWASSVIKKVDRVIVCFQGNPGNAERFARRARVFDQYPLDHIQCLGLGVPLAKQWCDWGNTSPSPYGVWLSPPSAEAAYRKSFYALNQVLEGLLQGCRNVFTHNPWGEYGHEVHVQVYRVVEGLASKHGFRVWFSDYGAPRSDALRRLVDVPGPREPEVLPTEIELAHQIREIYMEEQCWTGPSGYEWPEQERWFTTS